MMLCYSELDIDGAEAESACGRPGHAKFCLLWASTMSTRDSQERCPIPTYGHYPPAK